MKRDKTDALFSRYVRLAEGGNCRLCHKHFGVNRSLDCHHLFGRGVKRYRWTREACVALCVHCHFNMRPHSPENTELAIKVLGREKYEEMERLSHIPLQKSEKMTSEDIKKLQQDLKEKIRRLDV